MTIHYEDPQAVPAPGSQHISVGTVRADCAEDIERAKRMDEKKNRMMKTKENHYATKT